MVCSTVAVNILNVGIPINFGIPFFVVNDIYSTALLGDCGIDLMKMCQPN